MDLTQKKCIPCEIGTPPMEIDKARSLLNEVPGWDLDEGPPSKITKQFKFKDFKEALEFVNKVGEIAEAEGHHPDIKIVYNRVTLTLFTHAAKGLTQNDFILAAKVNNI